MVTAGLVELERHDGHPGQERGALLRHSAPQHQPTDPCTTLSYAAVVGSCGLGPRLCGGPRRVTRDARAAFAACDAVPNRTAADNGRAAQQGGPSFVGGSALER